jgi:thiol-disulfide isomerase/thioredoxin
MKENKNIKRSHTEDYEIFLVYCQKLEKIMEKIMEEPGNHCLYKGFIPVRFVFYDTPGSAVTQIKVWWENSYKEKIKQKYNLNLNERVYYLDWKEWKKKQI